MASPLGCKLTHAAPIRVSVFENLESEHMHSRLSLTETWASQRLSEARTETARPCPHQTKQSQSLRRGGKKNNTDFKKAKERWWSPKKLKKKKNALSLPVPVCRNQVPYLHRCAVTLLINIPTCFNKLLKSCALYKQMTRTSVYNKCLINVYLSNESTLWSVNRNQFANAQRERPLWWLKAKICLKQKLILLILMFHHI